MALRQVFAALALTTCLSLSPVPVLGDQAPVTGRCLSAEQPTRDEFFEDTGNAEIDRAIQREMASLRERFGVTPDVRILDDRPSPQAWASLSSIAPKTLGTIALGRRLLREQVYVGDHAAIALAGIMAHECSHIVQWQRGSRLVGRERELHADYLAGWYLGRRAGKDFKSRRKVRAFAKTLFAKGDHAFASPHHHGTPHERSASFLLGFRQSVGDLDAAYRAGEEFIARGALRPLPADVKKRRSPIWDRVQVACTHRTDCEHRTACVHKVDCRHLKDCEHKMACSHRVDCTHYEKCRHKMACVHRVDCEHRVPCVHRRHAFDLNADGRRVACVHRLHNWDPKHEFDLAHEYDLQHPDGDRKHDFDLEHEFDVQHPEGHPIHKFDLAHAFDTKHEFDLKHRADTRSTPKTK